MPTHIIQALYALFMTWVMLRVDNSMWPAQTQYSTGAFLCKVSRGTLDACRDDAHKVQIRRFAQRRISCSHQSRTYVDVGGGAKSSSKTRIKMTSKKNLPELDESHLIKRKTLKSRSARLRNIIQNNFVPKCTSAGRWVTWMSCKSAHQTHHPI